jgi:hypothetical protein
MIATDIFGEPFTFNKPDPWVRGLLAAEPGLHSRMAAFFQPYRRL